MLATPVLRRFTLGMTCGVGLLLVNACAPSHGNGRLDGGGNLDLGVDDGAATDDANPFPPPPTGDGGVSTHDPATCAEAATSKSYIGCDYWPTVTGNAVWNVFDYAVVISNPGMSTANVTVSGGALGQDKTATVAPGQLVKIGLPWVTSLKGPDANTQGGTSGMTNSVFATKGAYHLVSDVPVLVYQFNALEYKPGTGNNLSGVAWSTCPANGIPCLSYSNDASLLLPSTAMAKNYVVTGIPGDDTKQTVINTTIKPSNSSYAVVTATADATTVTVQLSKTADIIASVDNKITAVAQNAAAPAKVIYTLNAGDVIELLGVKGAAHDFTGSIIQATNPVQLMVGTSCTTNPMNEISLVGSKYSCDHVEETVLPVETWGKTYGVTAPTGPDAKSPGHTVRIYGGVTAASLTFSPAVPGAPTSIAPGQVAVFDTAVDFMVTGDHEFAVSSEQKSAQLVDTANPDQAAWRGDPSLSFLSAVEQYRDKYLFLAPTDYDVNFVDIVVPTGVTLTLDGVVVTQAPTALGAGYGALHLPLSAGMSGAHTLTGTAPFGIQVLGYGAQTSYQYPGGLDLKVISAPPPPIL